MFFLSKNYKTISTHPYIEYNDTVIDNIITFRYWYYKISDFYYSKPYNIPSISIIIYDTYWETKLLNVNKNVFLHISGVLNLIQQQEIGT